MKVLLLTVLIFFSYCLVADAQTNFDSSQLSVDGRKAYQILISATKFTVGPAGYGGYSEEERALHTLLREKFASDACLSIVDNANHEGGLYGLLGLRFLKSELFTKASEKYKLRPPPPERVVRVKKAGQGEIFTMQGCFFMRVKLTEVLAEIEAGSFDTEFELDGKPNKPLNKSQ